MASIVTSPVQRRSHLPRHEAPRPRGGTGAAAAGHVPALDGIRALAVAAVLAFHGGLPGASGGFLGVDAFFVLSGYLITSLLLAEWTREGGRIDLAAFWGRRVRRLLPALVLVVTTVAVLARAMLPPEEVRLLRGDGVAALLYVANWRMIFRGDDYFAQTAAPSPLEHTWSLGIEEQFYLAWPLVLCAVLYGARPRHAPGCGAAGHRVRRRLWWLVALCAAGAVASSVALALTYSPDDPGRAYYGTDTRGGAILVGAGLAALLALHGADPPGPRGELAAPVVARPVEGRMRRAALGAAAAVAAGVLGWASTHLAGTDEVLYRGAMAGISLAVAVVIAHVVLVPTGVCARLMAIQPLPALGRISYGVYLWHWPVFLAANADRTGREGLSLFAVRCVLTMAFALASYALVERPIRLRLGVRRPLLALPLTGAAIACGATAVVLSTSVPVLPADAGAASVSSAVDRFMARAHEGAGVPRRSPRPRVERATPPRSPVLHTRRPGQPVVVDVFGDSVAWTLVNYLPSHPELDVRDHTLMGCGITRTAPFRYGDRLYRGLAPVCRVWPHVWRTAIARDDPDVALILVGRWETMDRMLDGRWTHVGEPDFDAHLRAELDLAIRVAGARGAHVLLATEPYNRRWEKLDGSLYPEDQPERVTLWNELLRSVAARHPAVRVVDFGRRVSPEGRFTWTAGGYQVRSDGLHLTPSGVQGWIAPWLLPQLIDAVPERRSRRRRQRLRRSARERGRRRGRPSR